jgi:release factor glutamine methyltransferase
VDALVREARERLARAPFDTSPREAALLVGLALGLDEVGVLTRSRDPVAPEAAARLRHLLGRRAAGEPFAYLKGEREFYGRSFAVDRRVLIPRPETEHLVETTLELLAGAPTGGPLRVLDVGTGSGCIAVTLDLELRGTGRDARVVATDRSPGALAVARANARRLGARVAFVHTDLTAGLDLARFDAVVSNPPYLAPAEAAVISREVRDHEPGAALFADDDGFAVMDRLLALRESLRPGARLLLEIGASQQVELLQRSRAAGWQIEDALRDLAGRPRVVALRT